MVENTRPRPSAIAFARNAVLLLCLLAPSAWMIATIPPLWRDVDAYVQVTRDPRIATFLGHGPAYGYVAKVPLFLGEQWERWRGFVIPNPESGMSTLTDTGVGLLIIAQHLALAGAAFYFISAISRSIWVRLALSLVWASNALSYTFAHCVGSETLSLILSTLVAGKALRLIRSRHERSWTDWHVFAIALFLCLLSRHANLLLILLLPAAFLLSRNLRQAWIAIAVGLACLVVANSLTQQLARKTKFHPHSRIGFTFLWRLQFLKTLPPATRIALLEKVSARASSTEARQLVALLGQMHTEGTTPVAAAFTPRAIPLLFPREEVVPWEKLDVALNQMAMAFLLPPTPEHLQAARTDFATAMKMSVTEIEDMLFETTGYFFDHKLEMAGCAELVTFREASAETINGLLSQHTYFHLWQVLTLTKALVLWFGSLLVYLFVARGKKVKAGAVCAFALSMVGVGFLTLAFACVLAEFLPRYATPMWQLLLLSLYIFAGLTADLLATRSPQAAVRRTM